MAYQALRFGYGRNKTFKVRRKVAGEWVYDLQGVEKLLYRLPEVIQAVKDGQPIFITEGEGKADLLARAQLPATTGPFGAGKWLPQFNRHFTGANVVVVPDNDAPGQAHGHVVATALASVANVRVLKVPAPHNDIADWFKAGATLEDLANLVKAAPLVGKPSFTEYGGGFRATFPPHVVIEFRKLEESKRDGIRAETIAYFDGQIVDFDYNLGLGSQRNRTVFTNKLAQKHKDADWDQLLQDAVKAAIAFLRRKEPVVRLTGTPKRLKPEFLIEPLLPASETTLLYGDGEQGKSMLMLWVAACLAGGCYMPGMQIARPVNVLFLDWEWEAELHDQRLRRLKMGLENPDIEVRYLRMQRPLFDELDHIKQICVDERIGCTFLDSLGWAVNGDMNSAEVAIKAFNALREIPGAKMVSTHVSAAGSQSTDAMPYGNRYFFNGPRMVWKLQRVNNAIGLFCKKSNLTTRPPDIGLSFEADPEDGPLRFYSTDLRASAELASFLPLVDQITELLRFEPYSPQEIAEELGSSEGTVRVTLNRNKDRFVLIQGGGQGGRGKTNRWQLR